jgi:small subunit ribosomal protein S17e
VGNIRQNYIKRVAIELVSKYNDQFSDDFDHNKKVVAQLTDIQTTVFRNRIAGYVTTYRKNWEKATVEAAQDNALPATAGAGAA